MWHRDLSLSSIARHPVVRNAASLYLLQAVRSLITLVAVPYLLRTLGTAGWGWFAIGQAIGALTFALVDYGFNYSASRAIAANPTRIQSTVASVLGAKILLAVAAAGIAASALLLGHASVQMTSMTCAGVVSGIAQSFLPIWFFQGLQRLSHVVLIDVLSRFLWLLSLPIAIHGPGDAVFAVWLQAATASIAGVAALGLMRRFVRLRAPVIGDSFRELILGWPMFLFQAGSSVYVSGNAYLLSMFAPISEVGYYAAAERVSRAAAGLFQPIFQALYPHMVVNAAKSDGATVLRSARVAIAIYATCGTIIAALLYLIAPTLLAWAGGAAYGPSVPSLRILALIPGIVAVGNVFGIQLLLPFRRDRIFNAIVLSAAALHIGLTLLIVPRYGATGMAATLLTTETIVTVALYLTARAFILRPLARGSHFAAFER